MNYNYPNYYNNVPFYNPNANVVNNPAQNRSTIGFATVNGLEDAKSFIVMPNQTYWLKDNLSNLIYEKKTDSSGHYTMKSYELIEQNQENEFVKRSEFLELKQYIESALKPQNVGKAE